MSARSIQATLAAQTRHHPDVDHNDLRRELKVAKLADYIRKTVDAAPPLTAAQRDKLALLLSGGGSDAA